MATKLVNCNRIGQCRNCACVKAGKRCDTCLPSRLGHCFNSICQNGASLNQNEMPLNQSLVTTATTTMNTSSVNESMMTVTNTEREGMETGMPLLNNQASNTESTEHIEPQRLGDEYVDPWPLPTCSQPDFQWGSLDGKSFCNAINEAYNDVIHWKRNIFLLPSGAAGKSFIQEIIFLLEAFSKASALESIALKASFVMQILLLQKPSQKSKSRDHVIHLNRRLELWRQGNISSLIQEGKCIQRYLVNRSRPPDDNVIAQNFSKMMEQGKVRSALQYLSRNTTGGVLSLDDMIPTGPSNSEPELRSTRDVLQDKHPTGTPPDPSSVLTNSPDPDLFNPIIFENLNADAIHCAAMHTQGSAGPSGLDSFAWRRLCSSFGSASYDLCSALGAVGRRLCSSLVNPQSISALVACRLIPLNKCPGVRPIGVGEVPRRIIAKAILRIIGKDVEEAAGPLQVCAGQDGGCEAAVHAMRSIFHRKMSTGGRLQRLQLDQPKGCTTQC